MRRQVVPELLDDDLGTSQEVQDSLADLRMLNRIFGGVSTTTSLLREVIKRYALKQISFLDVGGATGDVARAARAQLGREGITLAPAILDRSLCHLRSAENVSIAGSAFQLPFRDASFDVVGCSLFLHHLEPHEIVDFMREATRVARRAVIVNDLRRSRLHWWAARAGSLIYRSRLTRHDAPASVQRAYTIAEMHNILRTTGYLFTDFSHHFFFRMGIIVWRQAAR
jgi:ubiquinone/menaquinone biosynthesis C-methylase UbiE